MLSLTAENSTLTFYAASSLPVILAEFLIAAAVFATACYFAITTGSSSGGNIRSLLNLAGHLVLNISILSFHELI